MSLLSPSTRTGNSHLWRTHPIHYLLQSNLSTEEGQLPFTTALNHLIAARKTASWSFAKLVPFAGTIEPETEARRAGKVFPLGSVSMTKASAIYGWTPGVVYDPLTFTFEAWRANWGAANLLNGQAVVTRFGDAKATEKVFMRPCQDLKTFTGLTLNPDELEDWQYRTWKGEQSSRDSIDLRLDTPVIVAPVKVITREWRTFVVGGKVVAWSQYAHLGRRDRSAQVDQDVIDYAQARVNEWQPAACFVLDIGETSEGLGVIEVNTLNSSGVYESDLKATLLAIEDLYESAPEGA